MGEGTLKCTHTGNDVDATHDKNFPGCGSICKLINIYSEALKRLPILILAKIIEKIYVR